MNTKRSSEITRKPKAAPEGDVARSVPAARELLHSASLRCTPSRLAVLQCLAGNNKPLSHVEVADQLTPLGFDRSTVYRCLVDLAEAGLAKRLDLGDHVWRFGVAGGHSLHPEDHPHFVCIDCGKAICLPEVTVQFTAPKGKRPAVLSGVTEVLLKGHCADCR